ncbi:MAG: O-antigen ligase family protein [Bacteroidales bacterium]
MDPELHLQYVLTALCLFLFWVIQSYRKEQYLKPVKQVSIFFSIGLLFLLFSLISLLISTNQADAIFIIFKYLLFFILLWTFTLFAPYQLIFPTFAASLTILGIILLIPAFYQLIGLIAENDLIIPFSTYKIMSFLPHRNLLAEVLLLILPFSVYQYFFSTRIWKFMGIACSILILFMIVILCNRATWLALIIGAIAVLTMLMFFKKRFLGSVNRVFIITCMAAILLGIVFFFKFSDTVSLKTHALYSLDFNKGSTKDRIELWDRTVRLIKENPLAGGGLGTWKINMLKYGNEGLVSENNTTFYQRPHNDFLWIAAEQGLIGFILYLALFVYILWLLWKGLQKAIDMPTTSRFLVCLFITSSFLIISFFSFPKERIIQNMILFGSWGLLLNLMNSDGGKRVNPARRNWAPVLVVVATTLVLLNGIFRLSGEMHTKKALFAWKHNRYEKCIYEVGKIKSLFYSFDETSTPVDWYAGLSHYRLGEYSKAAQFFKKAYLLNPHHIYVLNDYGSCLVKLGQKDKAVEFYRSALKIAPDFNEAGLNLCAIYYNENKISEAFDVLKNTNPADTTKRYQKTIIFVMSKLLDSVLKGKQPNDAFLHHKNEGEGPYEFYRRMLDIAIRDSLSVQELTDLYDN